MYPMIKKILLFFTSLSFFILSLASCSSGPCDYPDDRARDGSRCGDRAASIRPGGRNPDLNNTLILLITIGGVVGAIIFFNNKKK